MENEELVAIMSLEPIKSFETIGSLASALGIPFLMLESSGWVSRLSSTDSSSISSAINLAPSPEIVGKALAAVIKAKSFLKPVIVYKSDDEFLLLKEAAKDLIKDGVSLLELENNKNVSEQLSLGTVLYINIKF